MRGHLGRLAMVTLVCGPVLTTAAAGSAGRLAGVAGAVCGPASARTLAGDAVARVYVAGASAYGCSARARRSYRLGSTGVSIGAARIEAVRVSGSIAAYGLRISGVDTGYATVTVRRLTTGRVLVQRPATTRIGVEGFQSVDSLVLKADGAVAWIATARSIGRPNFVRQVQRLDPGGLRVLDFGSEVDPASLALHGSTVSWKHGTAVRTARLR